MKPLCALLLDGAFLSGFAPFLALLVLWFSQQQSVHDGKKSSTATATEQLEPTTKKRRRESQTDDHAEEEDFESVTNGSTIDESIIYDEVAGGDKLLPLSENPADDRETLDWFDSSFNVA